MNLAGYDEEGAYVPHSLDEEESDEEEEEEEDESIHFDEVTEVRFPGEVGPLGDRRLCKIRCVKEKWVGPLCATNEEGTEDSFAHLSGNISIFYPYFYSISMHISM